MRISDWSSDVCSSDLSKLPYISFFSAPTSCSHNANVKDTVTFFQACGNIPAVADAGARQQLSNDSLGLIANQLLTNPLALANDTVALNLANLPATLATLTGLLDRQSPRLNSSH